jgi:hypothetical protein
MASITTWVRIEARARDANLAAGPDALLADPLWLLARQYQLGELQGVDAGSAISARTRLDAPRVDAVRANSAAGWTPFSPGTAPLDVVLADSTATLERRARDGRALIAMLAAAPAAAALFLSKFPLAVDAATLAGFDAPTQRFYSVMTGRVPDGDAVAAAIAPLLAAADFSTAFGLDAASLASVSAICRTWLARRAGAGSASFGAWQSDQLAYAFEARAGGAVISAPLQATGATSWYSGDATPEATTSTTSTATSTATTTTVVSTALPTHVQFRGAPARRYWELEDAALCWPAITAGPGDVLRLLAVELGLTFADDWLVVPLDLPSGTLARVASHVVTDTFGIRQLVKSSVDIDGNNAVWRFCELTRDASLAGPLVFVAPAASPRLVGAITDALDLASDDVADILWAIDRTILGEDGIARTPPTATTAPVTSGSTLYQLGPSVAPIYHPYRERTGANGLELALSTVPGAPPLDRPDLPTTIAIGALPTRPVQLQTAAVVMRASDGSYHRVFRHVIADVAASSLPPFDFDQVG